MLLPQECTAHPQHTLTQALVRHDDVSVVLALLLPTLAPAVDADRLVGFYHIGDLKVWVHLGNSTDRQVSLQKGQRTCTAAPTRIVRLILSTGTSWSLHMDTHSALDQAQDSWRHKKAPAVCHTGLQK